MTEAETAAWMAYATTLCRANASALAAEAARSEADTLYAAAVTASADSIDDSDLCECAHDRAAHEQREGRCSVRISSDCDCRCSCPSVTRVR